MLGARNDVGLASSLAIELAVGNERLVKKKKRGRGKMEEEEEEVEDESKIWLFTQLPRSESESESLAMFDFRKLWRTFK
jgi:hypothetical protein